MVEQRRGDALQAVAGRWERWALLTGGIRRGCLRRDVTGFPCFPFHKNRELVARFEAGTHWWLSSLPTQLPYLHTY